MRLFIVLWLLQWSLVAAIRLKVQLSLDPAAQPLRMRLNSPSILEQGQLPAHASRQIIQRTNLDPATALCVTGHSDSLTHVGHCSAPSALLAEGAAPGVPVAAITCDTAIACHTAALEATNSLELDASQRAVAAEPLLQKAVALDPTLTQARVDLGCALATKGQRSEAIRQLREANRASPRHVSAMHNLGRVLGKRTEEGRSWMLRAGTYEPQRTTTNPNIGHFKPLALPDTIYYLPNGRDYDAQELLSLLYSRVKPYGCADLNDYINRRVLASDPAPPGHIYALITAEVKALKPQMVLLESAFGLEPHELASLPGNPPVVMYYGDAAFDANHHLARIMEFAKVCVLVVVVDSAAAAHAQRLGLTNVEYIPNFGYNHYHHPLPALRKDIDVLFTGQSYARWQPIVQGMGSARIKYVQAAKTALGSRLRVVGEDWELVDVKADATRIPAWQVDSLNRRSKIVLAVDAVSLEGFTSIRTFNTVLSGSLLMIAYFPGIEHIFRNGTHVVWFHNEVELVRLLRHYLEECEEERELIAREGQMMLHRNGWLFSNVLQYMVDKSVGRENRSFGERHAAFEPFARSVRCTVLQKP